MNSKRILIVDDEAKIVEVVQSYLENNGYTVYKAFNGREVLEKFDKFNPSLIILDLMLPDITGEEICKTIRKKSRVPIIMLTAKIDEENILEGLDIGADDYVTKPFSPRQLMARVTALLRRTDEDTALLCNIISFNDDDLIIDPIKYEVKKSGMSVNLTPNEYKILITLLRYPKKVFTRDELITRVMGSEFEGYDRIIDTHIT
jgi:DNA-binding response OmpR family regulator